jgi:hypothetical protein
MKGINMNCVLVSLGGQAELQPHDFPHPPTASILYCLHKKSPESSVNQGTNSILLPTKMKGLRPARQDSKFISTQDEGFWGRTIDE